jgi:hypothetical protein
MKFMPRPAANPIRKPSLAQSLFFRRLIESPEFTQFALILKRLTGLSMALNTRR